MSISENVKISLKGDKERPSASYYSEKWTLYENGFFGTDNGLQGTWKQEGNKIIVSLNPEGVGMDVGRVLERVLGDHAALQTVSGTGFSDKSEQRRDTEREIR